MHTQWSIGLAVGFFCLLLSCPLSAGSLYELIVTSEGDVASKGFSDLEEFVDQLQTAGLQQLIPDYTETSAARAELDTRGLLAIASYPEESTALRFQVPCAGTDLTFQGNTRDASQDLLLDFFKGQGTDSVTGIYQCFVSNSPVDPVAGNPNSLVGTMTASSYRVGTTTDAGSANLYQLGGGFAQSNSSGFRTNTVSFLPLNYVITIPNSEKPPYAVIFDLPIRYLEIAGAQVIDGSLGIGVRVPILKRWALTPMFRIGGVGSVNTGSFQGVLLGSVTSKVDFYFDDLRLSINNMMAYSSTIGISASDFRANYDVQNGIFRNGLSLEGSLNFKLFDQPTSWELQYVDTRVVGDRWHNDWWDEVVVSLGTRRRATRMVWQDLRLSASYAFGKDFSRWQVGLNYRF